MARNKKIRQSVNMRKTPRKSNGRISRITKPRLVEIGASSERKKKRALKAREFTRMKLLHERLMQEKNINRELLVKSPARKVILYPPIRPTPAPSTSSAPGGASTSKSPRRRKQSRRPLMRPLMAAASVPPTCSNSDPIVIDSEDDTVATGPPKPAAPLFYFDTTGGFNDKEVPRYEGHDRPTTAVPVMDDSSVMLVEEQSMLEEGEIRDDVEPQKETSNVLNRRVNAEEIPISDDDEQDEQEKGAIPMPVPKQSSEDQSVIFCSEVIDLDREEDRAKVLDFIPIGYDTERRKGKGRKSPRKNGKKDQAKVGEEKPQKEKPERIKRMVVIDGNNVAFAHTFGQAFSVKGLQICIEYFKKMGHDVKAVVPQFRLKKEKSTDQKLLEELYKKGDVLLAPSKNLPGQRSSSYDDKLIISVAEKFDGVIISNDNFRDLLAESDSWKKIIETRVIGYTWAMDAFFLPDDPYGRHGPKLKDLLEGNTAATSTAAAAAAKDNK